LLFAVPNPIYFGNILWVGDRIRDNAVAIPLPK